MSIWQLCHSGKTYACVWQVAPGNYCSLCHSDIHNGLTSNSCGVKELTGKLRQKSFFCIWRLTWDYTNYTSTDWYALQEYHSIIFKENEENPTIGWTLDEVIFNSTNSGSCKTSKLYINSEIKYSKKLQKLGTFLEDTAFKYLI